MSFKTHSPQVALRWVIKWTLVRVEICAAVGQKNFFGFLFAQRMKKCRLSALSHLSGSSRALEKAVWEMLLCTPLPLLLQLNLIWDSILGMERSCVEEHIFVLH